MELERIKRDVASVIQAFTQQEQGNKITQFNMSGLAQMLMGVVDGTVVVQQQGQVPGAEPNFPTAQMEGLEMPEDIDEPTEEVKE